MRILMFGWEFPPFISGGLGTACAGLTRGLTSLGHEVVFVLPRPVDQRSEGQVELRSPASLRHESAPEPGDTPVESNPGPASASARTAPVRAGSGEDARSPAPPEKDPPHDNEPQAPSTPGGGRAGWTEIRALEARLSNPYQADPVGTWAARSAMPEREDLRELRRLIERAREGDRAASEEVRRLGLAAPAPDVPDASPTTQDPRESGPDPAGGGGPRPWTGGGAPVDPYGGDLFEQASRYAELAVELARTERFDVIHAHDWLAYPAGLAVRRATGKPLVVHIHATEFDRSGEHVNQRVYDMERAGLLGADRVIAVSMLTRSICEKRYGVDPSRIEVVYNGVEVESGQPGAGARIRARDRIVLFLGRITMQKGPEYFVRAAQRVLEKMDDVKFVVAGSGDMAMRMIEQAASLGIGHKVLFTGFLRGADVPRVFRMADCYVMPSVSEPFGIAPLEAMSHDVPVIISKQSGVSEVLTHALKVDFWDVDEMANKIIAVLRHPPLSQTLRSHGAFELRRLTWDDAARRVVRVYTRAQPHAPA